MIPIGKKFFDQKNLLFICSIILLGVGRASACALLAPIAGLIGYACAYTVLAKTALGSRRFWVGWALFTTTILIQSSWFVSHPYSYIFGVWILLSLLFALPYTLLSLAVVSVPKKNPLLSSISLGASFALLEWVFTCLPCGYSFQCAALHLSWSLWPLQLASLIGGIGLSFFVFWCNILMFYWLYCRMHQLRTPTLIVAVFPYLVGGLLFCQRSEAQHTFDMAHPPRTIGFLHMEEPPDVYSRPLRPEQLHEQEWKKIFQLVDDLPAGKADLLVLPEGVVPYSAQSPLFPAAHLPERWKEENAYHRPFLSSLELSEMIASSLKTALLIGLEGRGIDDSGQSTTYNSCFFIPSSSQKIGRYDKQLLLPLGEYIPLPFLRPFLASYGIHDSFAPGDGSMVFHEGFFRICPLICYEETFSNYAVAALHLHPNLLVSLTNDCWYPALRRDHFELARLRCVEMGLPLIRSCNQGVSSAIDALGQVVAIRGETTEAKNTCVTVPLSYYTVDSVYPLLGPNGIAALLAALAGIAFLCSRLSPISQKVEHSPLR